MGKNNRARRAEKRRKKTKKLKKIRANQLNNSRNDLKSVAPVISIVNNPLKDISEEQRKELAKELGDSNQKKVQELLKELQKILRDYYPIALLSILSGYGLTIGIGDSGGQSKEGERSLNQSHIELLQALFLQIQKEEWGEKAILPQLVQETWDILVKLGMAFSLSRIGTDFFDLDEKDKSLHQLQEMVRGSTQSVRNWGYYSQVKRISTELYSFFDASLQKKYGFSATNAIRVFDNMVSLLENSLTERFNLLKQLKSIKNKVKLVQSYHHLIGKSQQDLEAFFQSYDVSKIPYRHLFEILLSHYDLQMPANFCYSAERISEECEISLEEVISILDYFSFKPGDLKDQQIEFLFLDNPVWNKPVVKFDELYFCPMPQLFFSFILVSIDALVEKIDKDRLHGRRAKYLEEKIVAIVKERFPEALTVSGLKWSLEGKQFETDLITFIDSHALIIEAKSHKISKSATRGSPDRIKRYIKRTVIEPSIQSQRFERRLKELSLDATIEDELRELLPVDLSKIHRIQRLSVTLEDFALIQTNLNWLNETGWLPDEFEPCPTMNLADFETLFNLLDHPVHIIHYLQRRTELEGQVNFMGTECDFMGLYLTTLLNLGKIMPQKESEIAITGMSAAIDAYYNSIDRGIEVSKPTPQVAKLFNDILLKLEERATPRWTEIGTILNRFSPDDQLKISTKINDLKKMINRNWEKDTHRNILVFTPLESSEFALSIVLYKDGNANRRKEFIERAAELGLEPKHVKICLVIAKNIDRGQELPYHFIGLCE